MTNKAAHKIRLKKSSKDQNPIAAPKAKHFLFWIFATLSVVAIISLSYLAYTSELKSELVMAFIVAISAFFLLSIWYLPKFYVRSLPIETGTNFDREKERLKLEDDTRKTFAQIIGGIVFLGGLIFTYNTFRLQQEGQFTDRFTKAVAQIGDDKLEVRLGGLYALERIAKDSPKDHWTVMEILSAFVREKAKQSEALVEQTNNKGVNDKVARTNVNVKIATDIQAVLTIIGRRKIEQDSKTDKINLREADLHGANLIRLNLRGVNLRRADLREADLRRADLYEADLSEADLSEADLREADLYRVNLSSVDLGEADLRGANLRSAENLMLYNLAQTIIDESTLLPYYFEDQKTKLLEESKKNLELKKLSKLNQ